jgi:hypothetical protein
LNLAEKVTEAAAKEDEFVSKFGDRELLDEAMSQITGAITAATAQARPQEAKPTLTPNSYANARTTPPPIIAQEETEAAELQPVPLVYQPTGFSGNGHSPNGKK